MEEAEIEYLKNAVRSFSLPQTKVNKLALYLDILNDYKTKLRLTGMPNIHSIIDELLISSLLASKYISKYVVMDVGSGSGILGIAIKIYIDNVKLYIVEKNMKKSAFLNDLINKLDIINVYIYPNKIEDIDRNNLLNVDHLLIRGIKLVNILPIILDKFPRGTSIIHFSSHESIAGLPVKILDQTPIPGNDLRRKSIFIFLLELT